MEMHWYSLMIHKLLWSDILLLKATYFMVMTLVYCCSISKF